MKRAWSFTFTFGLDHPARLTGIILVATIALGLLALLPSLWPHAFPYLHALQVDTDPENMLPRHEAVRVLHQQMKRDLSLHDMIVLGVVNETHPEGVFNPESLSRIYALTEYAKTLNWPDPAHPARRVGVIAVDLIAPSTVDHIEPKGPGAVAFDWLLPAPPRTQVEALAVRRKAERLPFLQGTLLSENGRAIALYLPLTSKDVSYRVAVALRQKIATLAGTERYFITGLPVAEDTFGVEMFKQMAISAPLAMLVIFVLMGFFFRKLTLILSPMIVAMVSVLNTMALLIATGHTVHIMSSMIPIFIMPIAVLDAIHILSEFFDRYPQSRDRRRTMQAVMDTLFTPMLYTSLTTAAGFASLALAPIPPVQVFGLFVAFGVLAAWFLTVTFIPAFVMMLPQTSLERFGATPGGAASGIGAMLPRLLRGTSRFTVRYARPILLISAAAILLALYGVSRIVINDNPVKWFAPSHPIRVADRVLNHHFGGTYMAYLALQAPPSPPASRPDIETLVARLTAQSTSQIETAPPDVLRYDVPTAVHRALRAETARLAVAEISQVALIEALTAFAEAQSARVPKHQVEMWEAVLDALDRERQRDEMFKQPDVLRYMAGLQDHLQRARVVGKSNSLADIVKTVHRDLQQGEATHFNIPATAAAVAQTLITYQNSHRPQDLWHFVTPDYRTSSIWVQLTSGDNRDMAEVVRRLDQYIEAHPPPVPLHHRWFGLTYINVIWQENMVRGMLNALLGSFLVVLIMMMLLFRSAL